MKLFKLFKSDLKTEIFSKLFNSKKFFIVFKFFVKIYFLEVFSSNLNLNSSKLLKNISSTQRFSNQFQKFAKEIKFFKYQIISS